MKGILLVFVILSGCIVFAQSDIDEKPNFELDDKYREDQFYFSVTYNLFSSKAKDISQSGFSTGFHLGFIRDMPINAQRNVAIGLGLGLSSNSYNQNVAITEINGDIIFDIIDETEINVSKNKFTTYLVEFPLELRWRASTPSKFSFLMVYTGLKLGYVFYNSTKFESDNGNLRLSNINEFNRIQYGLTLSVGYGTWNFHAYYALNPIFDDVTLTNGDSLDLGSFKLGLIFYIL
jgi:hypothetical protein